MLCKIWYTPGCHHLKRWSYFSNGVFTAICMNILSWRLSIQPHWVLQTQLPKNMSKVNRIWILMHAHVRMSSLAWGEYFVNSWQLLRTISSFKRIDSGSWSIIFCELIMQGWLNIIVLNKVSGMCQVSLWGTAGDHSRWSCSVTWENSQACPLSLNLHEPLYSGLSFYSGDLWLHELDCIFFLQWTPQNEFFGITTYIQMVCLQMEFSKGVVFATWFTGLFSRVSWQVLEISTRQSFSDSGLLLYL